MTRSRRPHLFTPHSDLCSPTTPHRSRVTPHLPADIGHGIFHIMAGYCYQILTNQCSPPCMSSTVTLEELQKGGGGSFTIKPAVTIAAVGRRRFAYHSCVECRKKTTQGCVQHPTAKTTARYCLRIQLKQEDISMWSTMWPRAF